MDIVIVKPYKHEGVFLAERGQQELCTRNLVPGTQFNDEEIIIVQNQDGTKDEYRVWNPFNSMLAAAILRGADDIWIATGTRVLYLGVAGYTTSYISDIVGPTGVVYTITLPEHPIDPAVTQFLSNRSNVITLPEDPTYPDLCTQLPSEVDVICLDDPYSDQVTILERNALAQKGYFITAIQKYEYESELKRMRSLKLWSTQYINLEPYAQGYYCVISQYTGA